MRYLLLLSLLSVLPDTCRSFIGDPRFGSSSHHVLSSSTTSSVGSDVPVEYNPTELEQYFRERPGLLPRRVFGLGGDMLSLAAGVGGDLLLEQYHRIFLLLQEEEEENRPGGEEPLSSSSSSSRRRGLWERRGPALRRTFERSGPTFIKFGQALASRGDLVGDELARELLPLQDRLTPFDDAAAMAVVAAELPEGSPDTAEILATAFGSHYQQQQQQQQQHQQHQQNQQNQQNQKQAPPDGAVEVVVGGGGSGPAAAASVSQVYRATIRNGSVAVAVKVQRPAAQGRFLVACDAVLLRRAARAVEGLRGLGTGTGAPLFKPKAVEGVDEFMSRLFEEMDFENERRNMQLFGETYSYGRGDAAREDETAAEGTESRRSRWWRRKWRGAPRKDASPPSPPSSAPVVSSLPPPGVRVPRCFPELCGPNVIVMEWIDGEKLLLSPSPSSSPSSASEASRQEEEEEQRRRERKAEEDMVLVRQGIDCTLSQLLETGIMHADPHGGNLLKVRLNDQDQDHNHDKDDAARWRSRWRRLRHPHSSASSSSPSSSPSAYQLAYLDFGLVSVVPASVRDGIVAAVVLLVDRRYDAVAELFGDLMLLPRRVLDDPEEFAAFSAALRATAERVLDFDGQAAAAASAASAAAPDGTSATRATSGNDQAVGVQLPALRFERLLGELLSLAPRFEFQLPPYFLNNARALGTLEGMVAGADPSFSVLQVVYPFALKRLLTNPEGSERLRSTLDALVHHDQDATTTSSSSSGESGSGSGTVGRRTIRWRALRGLLDDAARLLGVRRRRLVREVLASPPGRRFAASLLREQLGLWFRL